MVVIVDYGMGNIGSLVKMLRRLDAAPRVSREPADLSGASHLILPGVGSFERAARSIDAIPDLREHLSEVVQDRRTPILGICLGMQLLVDASDEGEGAGFGWIKGRCKRLTPTAETRVPHMGWNKVSISRDDPLIANVDMESKFYFVHSYAVALERASDELLATTHGTSFPSAIRSGNVMGVQFHPEKSHRHGLNILRNFLEIEGC